MTRIWQWQFWLATLTTACFLIIDITFVGANIIKVIDGGWASLLVAVLIVLIMFTGEKGGQLQRKVAQGDVPSSNPNRTPPTIVPGTAVFLTGNPQGTPTALLHRLKHYNVLHERNVILNVPDCPLAHRQEKRPYARQADQ